MLILPAIDLLGGKCVRLRQGDYGQVAEYSSDPAAMARKWVDMGARALHLVDLDGAKAGAPVNHDIIAKIAKTAGVPVEIGGGIRTVETAGVYLGLGVDKVIFGTAAIENPPVVKAACDKYPGRVMVGLDVKNGKPATKGWLETSSLDPIALANQFAQMGVSGIIYTDISRDGMLKGVNLEGVRHFAGRVSLPVIVSGGVATLDDVRNVKAMVPLGVSGLIVGKAIYDGALDLKEALAIAAQ